MPSVLLCGQAALGGILPLPLTHSPAHTHSGEPSTPLGCSFLPHRQGLHLADCEYSSCFAGIYLENPLVPSSLN